MNKFQEAIAAPVDMQAEIKAYEEAQALERGEVVEYDDPESPSEETAGATSEETPSADPDPAHQDDDTGAPPKHQGNAWKTMREKVRQAEEANRQLREEIARREGEQRAWAEYQRQQQAQQQVEQEQQYIDPTVNPIEAMQRLQQETQQMREALQQQAMMAEVQRRYRDDAQRFMAGKQDFQAAYQHALNARSKQLQLAGANPQQAAEQVFREEMELAYSALQQGRSPAEVIYQYAKDVYGFNGASPATTPQRDEHGRFIAEQRKAAAATSISTGGRSAAASRTEILSDEEGAKLQGAEFDKWFEQRAKQAGTSGGKKKIEWR